MGRLVGRNEGLGCLFWMKFSCWKVDSVSRFLGRLLWKCHFLLIDSLFLDQDLVFGCLVRKLTVH